VNEGVGPMPDDGFCRCWYNIRRWNVVSREWDRRGRLPPCVEHNGAE